MSERRWQAQMDVASSRKGGGRLPTNAARGTALPYMEIYIRRRAFIAELLYGVAR